MGGALMRIAEDGTRIFRRYNSKMPDIELLQDLLGGFPTPLHVKYEKQVTRAYVDADAITKSLPTNPMRLEIPSGRRALVFGPVIILLPDLGS